MSCITFEAPGWAIKWETYHYTLKALRNIGLSFPLFSLCPSPHPARCYSSGFNAEYALSPAGLLWMLCCVLSCNQMLLLLLFVYSCLLSIRRFWNRFSCTSKIKVLHVLCLMWMTFFLLHPFGQIISFIFWFFQVILLNRIKNTKSG